MKLFLTPTSGATDFREEILRRARLLSAAKKNGAEYLVLWGEAPLEAVLWIVASFRSPLAVTALSPSAPEAQKNNCLAQIPGEKVFPSDLREEEPAREKDLSDPWAVIFTSGTSGEPKGMALSGRALRASAFAHATHSEAADLCWLLNLPYWHVGGFSVISRAHFLRSTLALEVGSFSPERTKEWIDCGKVGGLSLVPTTLRRLFSLGSGGFPQSLRLVLIGGGACPEELLTEAEKRGFPLRRTYGLTENSSQAFTEKKFRDGLSPLPGLEWKLAEGGEIAIRSPFLASGYFQDAEFRPLPLKGGFYFTGDLGEMDGDRLVVKGRKTEVIQSGGLKIFPAELEAAAADCPGLTEAAFLGWPDKDWGEVVCASIVGDATPDTVRNYLETRIDRRKMPKLWVQLSSLPRSPLGKVRMGALREMVRSKLS